ncbi:MAG: hypothetical protein K2M87_02115 [Muribaculaceae bacterium]|nr:hypothetical protein [Muribaculaceae bacterium]
MITKICYVLTSSHADYYLEQMYVSMFSAKHHTPDCHITVVTDNLTAETFTGQRAKMIELADEIVVQEFDPALSAHIRSRFLKTNLRNLVVGDMLYIDCDTIIARDLSDIDMIGIDFGACEDTHTGFQTNPYRNWNKSMALAFGEDISNEEVFFNGGVAYSRDCKVCHEFYTQWNRRYKEGIELGIRPDQPSFNITNIKMGYPVKILPDEWNCELKHGIRWLKDAYIVHYLTTSPNAKGGEPLFILNDMSYLEELRNTGKIPKRVLEAIEDPFTGLARMTHCFAGDDIDLFQQRAYNWMHVHWEKDGENMLPNKLQAYLMKTKRILRKLKIAKG